MQKKDVSEAPAEAGSAEGDAVEAVDIDTQDIPMLDVCVCDGFINPLRKGSGTKGSRGPTLCDEWCVISD